MIVSKNQSSALRKGVLCWIAELSIIWWELISSRLSQPSAWWTVGTVHRPAIAHHEKWTQIGMSIIHSIPGWGGGVSLGNFSPIMGNQENRCRPALCLGWHVDSFGYLHAPWQPLVEESNNTVQFGKIVWLNNIQKHWGGTYEHNDKAMFSIKNKLRQHVRSCTQ